MKIEEVKAILQIDNTEISQIFGYKNVLSYANSSKKKKLEKAFVKIFELTRDHFKIEKDFEEFNPPDFGNDDEFNELKKGPLE